MCTNIKGNLVYTPSVQKEETMSKTNGLRMCWMAFAMAILAVVMFATLAKAQASAPDAVQNFSVGINAPSEVEIGEHPIHVSMEIQNIVGEEIPLTMTVELGGGAFTEKRINQFSTSENITVTQEACISEVLKTCDYIIIGTLKSDEKAFVYYNGYSNNVPGHYALATVDIAYPYYLHVERTIDLVEGTGPLTGTITTEPADVNWPAGQKRNLTLKMQSPVSTQFQTSDFSSTCPLDYMPPAFLGDPDKSYQELSWYVTLTNDANPGPCTISVQVTSLGTNETVTVSKTFEVGQPTYILNTDYFTMTEKETAEFNYLSNDSLDLADNGEWTVIIFPDDTYPFNYLADGPGKLVVYEPPQGIYTFTVQYTHSGLLYTSKAYVTVLPFIPLPRADVWAKTEMQVGELQDGATLTLTVTFGNSGPDNANVHEEVTMPEQVWENEEVLEGGQVVTYTFLTELQPYQSYTAEITVDGADYQLANNSSVIKTGEIPGDEMPPLLLDFWIPYIVKE